MNAINLGKSILWTMVARIGAQGLIVLSTILLARRLGMVGFGEYAFISAIMFIANALTTFGTDMLLIREIAAKDDLSRLPLALIPQLFLSGLFIVAVWVFGTRIPNQSPETIRALQIYSWALLPLAFFTVFTTALRGKQEMGSYNLLNLIMAALQLGIVLLIPRSVIPLFRALLLAQLFAALLAGIICTSTIRDFWREWHLSSFRLYDFLKESAPIALLVLLGMIYQRISITMMSTMHGAAETGIYSAASRAVEASKIAHFGVFTALYPAMAKFSNELGWSRSRTNISGLLGDSDGIAKRLSAVLIVGTIIMSIVLFVFSSPLVKFLYGSEFTASANVLKILAWTLLPFTINSYLTLSFLAAHRERIIGYLLVGSLLVLLILNLWWIPSYGVEGGAWATLAAETVQSILLLASAAFLFFVGGETSELSELS